MTTFLEPLKTEKNTKNGDFPCFLDQNPYPILEGPGKSTKCISSPCQRRGFWPFIRLFSCFLAILGYFRDFLYPGFSSKPCRKLRAFLEKSTNHGKCRRTRFFTPARVFFAYFHLGLYLLRSARSFLDESAFWSVNEPSDALNTNP